jgi:NAD(P)-dependent dehydrogenase (short-subunit alcohol dehydrogenase family)
MDGHRKVALVTGAARGIGAEVARQLGHHGFAVVVTARELAAARSISDALIEEGMRARPLQLDIADPDSIEALERALDGEPLDLLINNAAAFADWTETASTADLAQAGQVMDTNLFGTWGLIQALLPAMRRSASARIVNVGSGSGSFGDPTFGLATNPAAVSYAISKAALHALTVKLAVELASEGIDVVAVDPGLTATAPGMESMGARPVAEGAASVVAAATDAGITNGTFTRDQQILAW